MIDVTTCTGFHVWKFLELAILILSLGVLLQVALHVRRHTKECPRFYSFELAELKHQLATAQNELCTAADQIPGDMEGDSLSVALIKLTDRRRQLTALITGLPRVNGAIRVKFLQIDLQPLWTISIGGSTGTTPLFYTEDEALSYAALLKFRQTFPAIVTSSTTRLPRR